VQAQSPVRRSVAHLPSAAHMHRRRSLTTQVNGMSATASQLQLQASLAGIAARLRSARSPEPERHNGQRARVGCSCSGRRGQRCAPHLLLLLYWKMLSYFVVQCKANALLSRVRQKYICDEGFFWGPNSCFSEQLALIDYDIYNREILITLIRLFNECKEPISYSYVSSIELKQETCI
jgi:hypothetical protein